MKIRHYEHFIEHSFSERGYRWYITRQVDPNHYAALRITTEERLYEEFEAMDGPSASLSESDAQQLMDALWKAGLRPRNGEGTLSHVEAMKAHLEDMRTLVFQKDETLRQSQTD